MVLILLADIGKFEDPVIDPTQTYGEIFQRMKTGEAPKIVERASLPPDLQNKSTLFTIAGNLIYQKDLEEIKLQPKVGKVLKISELG
jgi:hypothetical protein